MNLTSDVACINCLKVSNMPQDDALVDKRWYLAELLGISERDVGGGVEVVPSHSRRYSNYYSEFIVLHRSMPRNMREVSLEYVN